MVGLQVLVLAIGVRIPVPEHNKNNQHYVLVIFIIRLEEAGNSNKRRASLEREQKLERKGERR